ncbi:MAG TPA: PQQ-dependent sugar dehydrogenase [Casimicrobiaceae bacterium]|nr:PQQ-dependent sugar dehydrogenase [Casimicrobiaceae bacterium]
MSSKSWSDPLSAARAMLAACAAAILEACGDGTTGSASMRFAVEVEDVVQIPASSESPPRARINFLFHAGDGSNRLFVNDMTGKIRVIKNGRLLPEPFLDMAIARKGSFTSTDLFEQGLNTFAFHPDFARSDRRGSGKFYTYSTETPQSGVPDFPTPDPAGGVAHHDVVAEWNVDPANPDRIDPSSRREILRIAHPLHDHVGGQLGFNPNARPGQSEYGLLYIGVGDGGNTVFRTGKVDALRTAQSLLSPLGKILRIDPLQDGRWQYSIPPGNPFTSDRQVLGAIWAYGLRNPARFSWDTAGDGKMMIADIGQATIEEIDVGKAGANYGWSLREGSWVVDHNNETRLSSSPLADVINGLTEPALQYGHHLGLAVTGGFVYRGKAIPALNGKYLFGDIVSGRVFFANVDQLINGKAVPFYELPLLYRGTRQTAREIAGADRADLRFGLDEGGEIYLLTKQDGVVRKLARSVETESTILPVDRPLGSLSR